LVQGLRPFQQLALQQLQVQQQQLPVRPWQLLLVQQEPQQRLQLLLELGQ
jgi:hypothetical protein